MTSTPDKGESSYGHVASERDETGSVQLDRCFGDDDLIAEQSSQLVALYEIVCRQLRSTLVDRVIGKSMVRVRRRSLNAY
jgi:hypothetical protein